METSREDTKRAKRFARTPDYAITRGLSIYRVTPQSVVTPIATRRWLWTGDGWEHTPQGGRFNHYPKYTPADWAFLAHHGLRWDDTERRGRGKALPHADQEAAATSPGEDAQTASTHPRWRQHLQQPDSAAGYVFLRSWARRITLLRVEGGSRRKSLPLPSAKRVRLADDRLTESGRAARRLERQLDAVDRARERQLGSLANCRMPAKQARGAWARAAGVRKGSAIVARREARRRVDDNVMSYAEHGCDAIAAWEEDQQHFVDTINQTAQGLPERVFDLLAYLLNDAPSVEAGLATLARSPSTGRFETSFLRGQLAGLLKAFRTPLRPWGTGRTGGWIAPPPLAAARSAVADEGTRLAAKLQAPKNGRPPKVSPLAVLLALGVAQDTYRNLCLHGPTAMLAMEGHFAHTEMPWAVEPVVWEALKAVNHAVGEVRDVFGLSPGCLSEEHVANVVAQTSRREGATWRLSCALAADACGLPRAAVNRTVGRVSQKSR